MQCLGHIYDKRNGEKILLLIRQGKYLRHIKLRKSGEDGRHFPDEEAYINEENNYDLMDALIRGVPIKI